MRAQLIRHPINTLKMPRFSIQYQQEANRLAEERNQIREVLQEKLELVTQCRDEFDKKKKQIFKKMGYQTDLEEIYKQEKIRFIILQRRTDEKKYQCHGEGNLDDIKKKFKEDLFQLFESHEEELKAIQTTIDHYQKEFEEKDKQYVEMIQNVKTDLKMLDRQERDLRVLTHRNPEH